MGICTNALSANRTVLECPTTTELFLKDGYDITACENVDLLYNSTDVIAAIVKLIFHILWVSYLFGIGDQANIALL